jgi:glycerol-3-phosphate dehydrogenase
VPRLYDEGQAYILQNPDRRIVFVIPFERHYTLIGTTDVPFDGDPGKVVIDPDEIAYLCESASRFMAHPVCAEDVVWTYAGVRPLYDDAAADPSVVTRDYVFDVAAGEGRPPALSVFGGKITTYRRLAEHALAKLAPFLPGLGPAWTGRAALPGGDIPNGDLEAYCAALLEEKPWLTPDLARRMARAYGTRVERLLGDAGCLDDLGQHLGAGLFEREVVYLGEEEWARSAEDILWRRSRLGLHGGAALTEAVTAYLSRVTAEAGQV